MYSTTNPIITEIAEINYNQVLVFGSNIDTQLKETVVKVLLKDLPGVTDISIDRDNWERVLRLECSPEVPSDLILAKVRSIGFKCYELVE